MLDRKLRDPLEPLFLLALLLAGAVMLCTAPQDDPDLWGHVRYGLDVLEAGRLPTTATYTFTAPGYPWINHENVSELAFALLLRHVGILGLTAPRCFLALSVVGLMILSSRPREDFDLSTQALRLRCAGAQTRACAPEPRIEAATQSAPPVGLRQACPLRGGPYRRSTASTVEPARA
jgi:hypothetical protein